MRFQYNCKDGTCDITYDYTLILWVDRYVFSSHYYHVHPLIRAYHQLEPKTNRLRTKNSCHFYEIAILFTSMVFM